MFHSFTFRVLRFHVSISLTRQLLAYFLLRTRVTVTG